MASQDFCVEVNANLMFCWLCIVIYPHNMNQQDALFIFNLFQ